MSEGTADKDQIISVDTLVHFMDCSEAWPLLTEKEQLYAYHFTQASWEGAKICAFQRSYESPALVVLLRAIFAEGHKSLKERAISQGVSEEEWKQLVAYAAATLQNLGNYKSFGDKKFVPELSAEKFWIAVKVSEAYKKYKEEIDDIWKAIGEVVYKVGVPFNVLGFSDENGLTTYYSAKITKAEATKLKDFQEEMKISPLNTRLIKLNESTYWLRLASAEKGNLPYIKAHEWKDLKIVVENGEFAFIMKKMIHHLEECLKYADNHNKKEMLKEYIEHFKYGE
jgi:dipeptidyl-peptidase-3